MPSSKVIIEGAGEGGVSNENRHFIVMCGTVMASSNDVFPEYLSYIWNTDCYFFIIH